MINKNKIIGIIGIGVFTYLSISSLSIFVGDLIKDFLIFSGSKPYWSFCISELINLVLFIVLINILINWVYYNYELMSNKVLKYFVRSFVTYFVIQLIIIVYPSLKSFIDSGYFNEGTSKYLKFLNNNYMLYFVQSILYYVGEITAIILIYKKIKKR